jgi:hypothetical protein
VSSANITGSDEEFILRDSSITYVITKDVSNENDKHIFSVSHMHEKYYLPMKYKHITTKGIDKINQSLTSKDSCGFDEISNRILKISAPFIVPPLTYILNKALLKGMFPDRMNCLQLNPYIKMVVNMIQQTIDKYHF